MVDITYKRDENNFYSVRKATGYSQDEFAILLLTCRKTISKWENHQFNPNHDQTQILLSIGINTHYMYGIGNLTLDGFTIEDVKKNIKKRLTINPNGKKAA